MPTNDQEISTTSWILLDTETSGIRGTIFVVELAAQRMVGWHPVGEPFRRLLNQNRDMPREASRVHGYTREILARDGEPPRQVYEAFAEYAADSPLCSFNLAYDLEAVLKPEWERLGVPAIGGQGFCLLRLAQRLLDPVPAGNCQLQTLRQYYRLPERGAHTALGDVQTAADLLVNVLHPIAERRGVRSWTRLIEFLSEEWYPSRIGSGEHKGRLVWEARHDSELQRWLESLVSSQNQLLVRMGKWYLKLLDSEAGPANFEASVVEGSDSIAAADHARVDSSFLRTIAAETVKRLPLMYRSRAIQALHGRLVARAEKHLTCDARPFHPIRAAEEELDLYLKESGLPSGR